MSTTPMPALANPGYNLSGKGLKLLLYYRGTFSFEIILFLLFSSSFLLAGNPDLNMRGNEILIDKNTPSGTQNIISSNFLSSSLTNPTITVRLTNPQYDCGANRYCLDVEFQSDQEDQELFGMNVRFFYDDAILELDTFIDFEGGYGTVAPSPPTILQSPPGNGYLAFGFGQPGTGVFDFVNGAIQKTDISAPPIFISTSGWTKIFKICFVVDDPDIDSANFCPPIVWDLEQDPANGGYGSGSDGVVITVIDDPFMNTTGPTIENVVQFNWEYTGNGSAPPYGQPVETNCFAVADAAIDGSAVQGCYFQDRIFQPMQDEVPNVIYEWNFGEGAVPATATGYGPHTVYYDTMGMKTVTLVISPSEPGVQCADSSEISFLIINCPGNITGTVKSTANVGISGVNLRLYTDVDTNGIADNAISVRSVFTNGNGLFSMASVTPGHYVIEQVQPTGWITVDDGDLTDDGDVVENIDSLDNLIPVTLTYSEHDATNYFTEGPAAGSITGSVFTDLDNDQFPDPGEGLSDITIQLFVDADMNGIADSSIPLASQVTISNGTYVFSNVAVGHYVVSEVQPAGYSNVKDFDSSDDNDVVPNSNIYNDTIPVTITNGEVDANNYFIDIDSCSLWVTNTNTAGGGSLRDAIECAMSGDTIRFDSSLCGLTINITSERLVIDKNLVFYSADEPRVTIASLISGLFDIEETSVVEFRGLNIISGLSGNIGAAFNNEGILKLYNINVFKNSLLPPGEYLIYNSPGSQLFLSGSCFLEMN